MVTEEEKHRIKEEEKFDAEIRNKLEGKSTYGFAWLPSGVTFIGAVIIAAVLLTSVAALLM